jgi:uncharacterized protein YdcH (DUF465 family)
VNQKELLSTLAQMREHHAEIVAELAELDAIIKNFREGDPASTSETLGALMVFLKRTRTSATESLARHIDDFEQSIKG